MEEFDALMIRVNNIYYGRGRLIMSPEYVLDKSESSCGSSCGTPEHSCETRGNHSDAKKEQQPSGTTAKEVGNSRFSQLSRATQFVIVDSDLGESRSSGCIGLEESHKGHDSVFAVDLKMKDGLHDNSEQNSSRLRKDTKLNDGKPQQKSIQVNSEESRRSLKGTSNKAGMNQEESIHLKKGFFHVGKSACQISGSDVYSGNEDQRMMKTSKQINDDAVDTDENYPYAKSRKIDKNLLNNPWLSGEIMEKKEKQMNFGSSFSDASLIFRDKLRKWKSAHDIRYDWERSGKNIIDHDSCRPQNLKHRNEIDLFNNEGLLRNSTKEKERGESCKPANRSQMLEDWMIGKDENEAGGTLKKEAKLMKSHGKLNSVVKEIQESGGLATKAETGMQHIGRDYIPMPSRLTPAKSLGNLIVHFENLVDKSGSQDDMLNEKAGSSKDLNETYERGLAEREKGRITSGRYDLCYEQPDRDACSMKMKNYDDGGVDDVIKIKSGDELKCQRYNNNYRGHVLAKIRPISICGGAAMRSCAEWPETIRPLDRGKINGEGYSNNSTELCKEKQDGLRSRKESTELDERMSHRPFVSYDRFDVSHLRDLSRLRGVSPNATKSMADLTQENGIQQSQPRANRNSFYRERFERGASKSRLDEPCFDPKFIHWQSLEELRTKFEAKSEDSLDGKYLDTEDGMELSL